MNRENYPQEIYIPDYTMSKGAGTGTHFVRLINSEARRKNPASRSFMNDIFLFLAYFLERSG